MINLAPNSPSYSNYRLAFAGFALTLLAVPLIAMQFTGEVNWGPGDFVVMGGLLAGFYAGIELTLRVALSRKAVVIGIAASLGLFLAVWAELAIGVFD